MEYSDRTYKHSKSVSYLIVSVCLVLISCSSTPPKFNITEDYPQPVASKELTCPSSDLKHCSIESPFREFESISDSNTHRITLLEIGEKSLEVRIHLIRSARKSIEVQTFIWANDETGNLVFDELVKAARRGVKVRLLADQLGAVQNAENAAKAAVLHENLQIQLYNPLFQESVSSGVDMVKGVFLNFSNLNNRMHNKLMVFDERIGIMGGRNIENKYFDYDPEFNFIDRDVIVTGPATADMLKSFNEYWNDSITVYLYQLKDVNSYLFTDGIQNKLTPLATLDLAVFNDLINRVSDYDYINEQFVKPAFEVEKVKFTADRPQKPFIKDLEADYQTIDELYNVVSSANESLLMQTPYFIISGPAYDLLLEKRKQNPNLIFTVLTNSLASVDHFFVYALAFKRKKRNIQKLGFQIHELKPVPEDIIRLLPNYTHLAQQQSDMSREYNLDNFNPDEYERFEPVPIKSSGPRVSIHAKTMVVDGKIAVIGSHNFDPRSLELNTESTLTIYDETIARKVEQQILLITEAQNSWTIAKREIVPVLGQISGFLGSISRMLPIFDIWPFRYSSSFDLNDGMSPVSTEHTDFYLHYKDVGQFPETDLGDKQLMIYLISAFGAVAEPQM